MTELVVSVNKKKIEEILFLWWLPLTTYINLTPVIYLILYNKLSYARILIGSHL